MLANRIDTLLARLLRGLAHIEIAALVAALSFIVISITVQVVTRYIFGNPIVWVEEASTYAFIWIAFLGASVGAKQVRQIKVELLSSRLGEVGRRRLLVIGHIGMLLACLYLIKLTPAIMAIESRSYSISLPFTAPRMWFYSLPLFVFACLCALTSVAHLFRLLVLKDTSPMVAPFLSAEAGEPV